MTELLATSKSIKELNQAGFLSLFLDLKYIENFAIQQPTVDGSLSELQQLCALFLECSDPKEILDDSTYRKKYSKLNLRKVAMVMDKYRNDKHNYGSSTGNAELDAIWSKMPIVHKTDA